jgi:hypothetical protein
MDFYTPLRTVACKYCGNAFHIRTPGYRKRYLVCASCVAFLKARNVVSPNQQWRGIHKGLKRQLKFT